MNGGIIELKEINLASVIAFLNQYTDKEGTITFNGEQYERNPNFMIIGTHNPIDPILYSGTKPMNTATRERFKPISVKYLDEEETLDTLMHITTLTNQELIAQLGGEVTLKKLIKEIFTTYILPIRREIEYLSETQEDATSEKLKLYARIHINLDKLIYIFKNMKTSDAVMSQVRGYIMPQLRAPESEFIIK
jgi:MoxR-like ATPase